MLSYALLLQAGATAIPQPIPANPPCAERDSGDLIADLHCTPHLPYRADALDGGGPVLPKGMAERAFDTAARQEREVERKERPQQP